MHISLSDHHSESPGRTYCWRNQFLPPKSRLLKYLCYSSWLKIDEYFPKFKKRKKNLVLQLKLLKITNKDIVRGSVPVLEPPWSVGKYYCMSKKSCPLLYSEYTNNIGQNFLDIQYLYIINLYVSSLLAVLIKINQFKYIMLKLSFAILYLMSSQSTFKNIMQF